MKFLMLTHNAGHFVWVNMVHVVAIHTHTSNNGKPFTRLHLLQNHEIDVKETPEEIGNMIKADIHKITIV